MTTEASSNINVIYAQKEPLRIDVILIIALPYMYQHAVYLKY